MRRGIRHSEYVKRSEIENDLNRAIYVSALAHSRHNHLLNNVGNENLVVSSISLGDDVLSIYKNETFSTIPSVAPGEVTPLEYTRIQLGNLGIYRFPEYTVNLTAPGHFEVPVHGSNFQETHILDVVVENNAPAFGMIEFSISSSAMKIYNGMGGNFTTGIVGWKSFTLVTTT